MPLLLDTNILVRIHAPADAGHAEAVALFEAARANPEAMVVCAQNLIEFWAVATRPVDARGLGMTAAAAGETVDDLLAVFRCLPEPPDVAGEWLRLVRRYNVAGKPAHDARLVAIMGPHGLTDLVTFNTPDFKRFGDVRCHTPAEVLAGGMLAPDH